MSAWQNVLSAKCQGVKMSVRPNVKVSKCWGVTDGSSAKCWVSKCQKIVRAPVNVVLELDVTKKVHSRVQGDCMAHSCLPLMLAVLIKGHDGLTGMQCSQI